MLEAGLKFYDVLIQNGKSISHLNWIPKDKKVDHLSKAN
jgi:hypothetical protein